MPPAIIFSDKPAFILANAKPRAALAEAHCISIVVAGTASE